MQIFPNTRACPRWHQLKPFNKEYVKYAAQRPRENKNFTISVHYFIKIYFLIFHNKFHHIRSIENKCFLFGQEAGVRHLVVVSVWQSVRVRGSIADGWGSMSIVSWGSDIFDCWLMMHNWGWVSVNWVFVMSWGSMCVVGWGSDVLHGWFVVVDNWSGVILDDWGDLDMLNNFLNNWGRDNWLLNSMSVDWLDMVGVRVDNRWAVMRDSSGDVFDRVPNVRDGWTV